MTDRSLLNLHHCAADFTIYYRVTCVCVSRQSGGVTVAVAATGHWGGVTSHLSACHSERKSAWAGGVVASVSAAAMPRR